MVTAVASIGEPDHILVRHAPGAPSKLIVNKGLHTWIFDLTDEQAAQLARKLDRHAAKRAARGNR